MHHTYILNICRQPGISQEALAKKIFVNKSNVARQLAILEERGFVTRTSSPTDKRQLLVYPTEKALAVQPAIQQLLQSWNEQVVAGFSATQQQQLIADLEIVKENSQRLLAKDEAME